MNWHVKGRNAGETPGSLADAQARIRETQSFLDNLGSDALDAGRRAIHRDRTPKRYDLRHDR